MRTPKPVLMVSVLFSPERYMRTLRCGLLPLSVFSGASSSTLAALLGPATGWASARCWFLVAALFAMVDGVMPED